MMKDARMSIHARRIESSLDDVLDDTAKESFDEWKNLGSKNTE